MTTPRPLTTILLAADYNDGRQWLAEHPQPGNVHIVTARSVKHGAGRGLTVDLILETPAAEAHPAIGEMRTATEPALIAGSTSAPFADLAFETVRMIRVRNAPRLVIINAAPSVETPGVRREGNVYIIDGIDRQLIYRIVGGSLAYRVDICELVHDSAARS